MHLVKPDPNLNQLQYDNDEGDEPVSLVQTS